MPKTKAERLKDYLFESDDIRERIEKLSKIALNEAFLEEDERDELSKAYESIFSPTVEVEGEKYIDTETALKNYEIFRTFTEERRIAKGKSVVKWQRFFDKRDGEKPGPYGRNKNIERALSASFYMEDDMMVGGMGGQITGVANNENIPKMPDKSDPQMFIVSHTIQNPSFGLGLEGEEKAYYSIGLQNDPEAMEKSERKFLQKVLSEKHMRDYPRPWYTKEEQEEFFKLMEFDHSPESEAGKALLSGYENAELPENMEELINSNPETYMDYERFRPAYGVYVLSELSKDKTLDEIMAQKPTRSELRSCEEIITQATKDPGEGNELAKLAKAGGQKLLTYRNEQLIDKVRGDKTGTFLDRYIDVCKAVNKLTEFKAISNEAYIYRDLKLSIITSKEDYELGKGLFAEVEENFDVAYEGIKVGKLLSKEEEATLLEGGFLSSATTRGSSILSSTYIFNLLQNQPADVSKGYSKEISRGAGAKYLDFMKENVVFKPGALSEPIDDKEALGKAVKNHAEFYRKWAEFNATQFVLDDYTDMKKVKRDMGKIHFLYNSFIDCSQNSETLRGHFKEDFVKAFGGEEAYNRMTGALDSMQAIAKTLFIAADTSQPLIDRVTARLYLEKQKKAGVELKGKNALQLDPNFFSMKDSTDFKFAVASLLDDLPNRELEKIAEKGIVSDDLWKKIDEAVLDFKGGPEAVEGEKVQIDKIKEDMQATADILGVPYQRKSKDDLSTGFEEVGVFGKFSPELRAAFSQKGKDYKAYMEVFAEFKGKNPDKMLPGLDERSVFEFISFTEDKSASEEEKRAYAKNFCEKFFGSESERKAILDKVFSEVDNFSFQNYDLSCLSGKDTGERGKDNLTASERSFINLSTMVHMEQSLRLARRSLAPYFEERYPSLSDTMKLTSTLNEFRDCDKQFSKTFMFNNLSYNLYENREWSPDYGEEYWHGKTAVANDLADKRTKIVNGASPESCDSVVKLHLKPLEDEEKRNENNSYLAENIADTSQKSSVGYQVWDKLDLSEYDAIYIDGKRALDYIEQTKKPGEMEMDSVGKLIGSGEHRIDVVQFSIDKKGDVVPFVQTIEPFDANVAPLYKNDPDRESRVSRVRSDILWRMGKNRNFSNFMDAQSMHLSDKQFETLSGKYKANPEPEESIEDLGKRLSGELSGIDHWYHKNSTLFKNVLEALKTPNDPETIVEACNAYIGKYYGENDDFKRSTELGNDRMQKICEIKGIFKDIAKKAPKLAKVEEKVVDHGKGSEQMNLSAVEKEEGKGKPVEVVHPVKTGEKTTEIENEIEGPK